MMVKSFPARSRVCPIFLFSLRSGECQTRRRCPAVPRPRTRGGRDPVPRRLARRTATARAGATTTAARPTARLQLRLRPGPLPPVTTRGRGGRRWPCHPKRSSCGRPASGTSDTAGVAAATDHRHQRNDGPACPFCARCLSYLPKRTVPLRQWGGTVAAVLDAAVATAAVSTSGQKRGFALRGCLLWLHFVRCPFPPLDRWRFTF